MERKELVIDVCGPELSVMVVGDVMRLAYGVRSSVWSVSQWQGRFCALYSAQKVCLSFHFDRKDLTYRGTTFFTSLSYGWKPIGEDGKDQETLDKMYSLWT